MKNTPQNLFEKLVFIDNKYEIINNNIEIFRTNVVKNKLLRTIFYFNQFINKKLEIFSDKFMNPEIYTEHLKLVNNQKFKSLIEKQFINQRMFADPNFLKLYFYLKKLHKREELNIIHSSPIYISANIYAYKFSIKNDIPFFCTPLYHINPYSDYIFYPSYQQILKKATAIIACTDLEKSFYKKYSINHEKIHVIPPGIDLRKYETSNVKQFKIDYSIPENSPILLFMGRKTYEKGVFNIIYALKYLIQKFKDIRLIIAGPTKKEYNIFFKRLPKYIKKHIIDLGIIDDKLKSNVLACCDIFVLPSIDDAFGIVFLEAWAFKKPVIGVFKGNVEGLIDNDLNGCLIHFNNVKALAVKIEELLDDEKRRKDLGQNGYNKLLNNYLLELTNKKMLELYRKFI
ncbi:MAG: glycosyltransferase family 1 protein [Promethearchaeota archaeon]|nr:MAG: glycosyltransferase family 1 protein [Candidatus Lokiarchaeota archaeon]